MSAVTTSSSSRVRCTETPSAEAASSPNVNASSEPAASQHSSSPTSTTLPHTTTSRHDAVPSEPSSQNSTPRVCSASAAVKTMNDVSAENSCVAATPARIIRSVVPPASVPSSSTSAKASSAPTKAPEASVAAPASGLRSSDCSTTPQSASPAPQAAASTARGRRRSQMIASWMPVRPDGATPNRDSATANASPGPSPDGPIVVATAIETSRPTSAADHRTAARPARAGRDGPEVEGAVLRSAGGSRVTTARTPGCAAPRPPSRRRRPCGSTGSGRRPAAARTASRAPPSCDG